MSCSRRSLRRTGRSRPRRRRCWCRAACRPPSSLQSSTDLARQRRDDRRPSARSCVATRPGIAQIDSRCGSLLRADPDVADRRGLRVAVRVRAPGRRSRRTTGRSATTGVTERSTVVPSRSTVDRDGLVAGRPDQRGQLVPGLDRGAVVGRPRVAGLAGPRRRPGAASSVECTRASAGASAGMTQALTVLDRGRRRRAAPMPTNTIAMRKNAMTQVHHGSAEHDDELLGRRQPVERAAVLAGRISSALACRASRASRPTQVRAGGFPTASAGGYMPTRRT